MKFSAILFFGWYYLLDKTIYASGSSGGIGPKEHSFFITFLCHGLNVWSVLTYFVAKFFRIGTPVYVGLFFSVVIFIIGYRTFFKKNASRVLANRVSNGKAVLFVLSSLVYAAISVLVMFYTGDYVRDVVFLKK